MSDETPTNPDELKRRQRDDSNGDLPASLIFTELVRQAAARKAAEDTGETDAVKTPPVLPQFVDDPDAPETVPSKPKSAPKKAIERMQESPQTPEPPKAAEPPDARALQREPQVPAPVYAQAGARVLTDEERQHAAALESERIRRVKKRQAVRRARRVGVLGGVIRALFVVSFASALMATILSWFTSPDFLRADMRRNLSVALYSDRPTPTPTIAPTPNWARTIGIVSGHRGPGNIPGAGYDPGAVCPDGLTENEINFAVASQVVLTLRQRGYSVLLLDEFDSRLNDFQAAALVSIHSNTCAFQGELVKGFIVAKAAAKPAGGPDDILAECVAQLYEPITGMNRRFGTTIHMTDYHSFREIHPLTPGVIIELGFMLGDRDLLENHQDVLARGVAEGILCFLEPQDPFGVLPATPEPSATPTPEL